MNLNHQQAQEYIQAAADGLLDAAASRELDAHLAECAECRAYAAQVAHLEQQLRRGLQARWPAPRYNRRQVQGTIDKVQSRAERRSWIRHINDLFQAVAWAGLIVALVVTVAWIFRIVMPQLSAGPAVPQILGESGTTATSTPQMTPSPEAVVEASTPVPSPAHASERSLTICTGAEPDSLYLYGTSTIAAGQVQEAIYDGPIDSNGYGYQPVILEKLPSLSDGDAVLKTIRVETGGRVLDAAGSPIRLEPGVRVQPAGCTSPDCAIVFDGTPLDMEQLVVTFTLRPGITWSDGEPLTAYDSVYSFELAADPDTETVKTQVERTARYEVLDDYHTVWTGLPGYRDPAYFTNFWTPLPAHAWADLTPLELLTAPESSRNPLGWGPFVIQEWVAGDHIKLVKNENYWRATEGLPRVDTVTYHFVGDKASANVASLLAGECDILDQTTQLESQGELLLELQSVGKLNATFATGTVWEHADFGINPAGSYDRPDFFQDVRVRRAIAYCLDRQSIVDSVLYGQSVVLDSYLPPEHPLYNPDVHHYPHDAEAGVRLLEAAGWIDDDGDPDTPRVAQGVDGIVDGTPLSFSYWTTSASQRQAAGQIVAASLQECGIRAEIEYWNTNEFFANGPEGPVFGRHFDVAQFAWLVGVEPPCDLYTSSQIPGAENAWTGENATGFSDPEYDAACAAALQTLPGTAAHEQNHHEAQRIFAEQLPVIPLYLRLKLAATRPDLQGFTMDPTARSEFWNIEEFELPASAAD
jgi:peptide/nickel transport system substrate-binding protein